MKHFSKLYSKNIPDECIPVYKKSTEIKLMRSETLKVLHNMKARCECQGNNVTKYIFNRLISDASCLDRIIFVTQPYFRNHLISEMSDCIHIHIHSPKLDDGINDVFSAKDKPEEALKAFFNIIGKFEFIFVYIEKEQLLKELLFEKKDCVYIFKV